MADRFIHFCVCGSKSFCSWQQKFVKKAKSPNWGGFVVDYPTHEDVCTVKETPFCRICNTVLFQALDMAYPLGTIKVLTLEIYEEVSHYAPCPNRDNGCIGVKIPRKQSCNWCSCYYKPREVLCEICKEAKVESLYKKAMCSKCKNRPDCECNRCGDRERRHL